MRLRKWESMTRLLTLKKEWDLTSSASPGPPPSLSFGSFTSSLQIKSLTHNDKFSGIGGSSLRIRLEIKIWSHFSSQERHIFKNCKIFPQFYFRTETQNWKSWFLTSENTMQFTEMSVYLKITRIPRYFVLGILFPFNREWWRPGQ